MVVFEDSAWSEVRRRRKLPAMTEKNIAGWRSGTLLGVKAAKLLAGVAVDFSCLRPGNRVLIDKPSFCCLSIFNPGETSAKVSNLEFCHPELVEGSAALRVATIFWRLILRQAQDDGLFKERVLQRSPGGWQ